MKYSHQNLFTNEIKNINSLRNKEINKLNRNTEKKTFKENTKQNSLSKEELYYYKNKNKKNRIIYIEPIKSATIPSKKKIMNNNNNILSEENLISLMNKYINFSLNKNPNPNKKKKLIRNNLTNLNEEKKYNINEDNKKMYMESLIKKGIITEIKDLQKPKKETFKEKLAQKKKSFLEDIGIEPSNITSFQESTNDNNNKNKNIEINDNNNDKINDDEINDINNNYYKTFTGICSSNKRIKYFSPKHNYDLFLYDDESFTDKECKKTPLKPKINQFEYILKIKKERSKIQTNPNYMSVEPEKPSKKLKFIKILTPKIENTINDSFRRKNKKLNKKINYTNYNINRIKKFNNNKIKLNNFKDDDYFFSYKKNYRSPDELNIYIKNKKEKEKENEEKRTTKKNKDLFIKYKNLCTLNNNYYKKNSPKYYNTISMRCKTHISGFNIEDKKRDNNKKKLNENIRDNNSTLIDAKEYYLNILESKKLIIKNLYSKTETKFYNNKINKNENLKIIGNFFNKDFKNNEQNNIIINKKNDQKEMLRKISKKINDTLIKAKKIFSLEENNDQNIIIENNKDNNIIKHDNINNNKKIEKQVKDFIITEKIMKKNKKEIKNENLIKEGKKEIIKNNNNKEIKEKKEKKENEDIKKDINKKDYENIKINGGADCKNKDENEIKDIIHIKENENKINSKEGENIPIINTKYLIYFTDIIKKYLRKNIFSNLYNYYLKIVVLEHYFTSISYFIAFCKKYPFIKLREHFYKSKVFTSLKELINPFIKKYLLYFFSELKKNKKKKKIIKNNFVGIKPEKNINNKKEGDFFNKENKENKVEKKIIENNFLIENLIDESSEDKNINNNISDFYSNTLNTINTNKDNTIKSENNNNDIMLDKSNKNYDSIINNEKEKKRINQNKNLKKMKIE